jgi:hypothetical protein
MVADTHGTPICILSLRGEKANQKIVARAFIFLASSDAKASGPKY